MTVRPTRRPTRRGTMIPLLATAVVALFGFIALAIDLGMMMVARTECQNAADAAALAGVRTLNNNVPAGTSPDAYDNGKPAAEANARTAVTSNIFLNTNYTDSRVTTLNVGLYDYNSTNGQFAPDFTQTIKPAGKAWSAVEVVVDGTQPTYFARVLGITSMGMSARAVAVHRPRDIALVLDYTGSMGYGTTVTYNVGRVFDPGYRSIYNSNDPDYPRFGHYARYAGYQVGSPNGNQKDPAAANRPHPFYQTATVTSAPYVYAPANVTVTTENGPPVIKDFLYDPVTTGADVTTASLTNAFHANSYSLTRTTSGTALTAGPTPAPANFGPQTDTPTVFDGDKWPRKRGYVAPATGADWSVTSTNGAAVTAAEYLGWTDRYTGTATQLTTMTPASTGVTAGRTADWTNFRDATWERHGYDLDIADYVANRTTTWDPRFDWDPGNSGGTWSHHRIGTPSQLYRPNLKPAADRFKGYTMGPGYWGKTFFIWPPDPRWGNPAGIDSNGAQPAALGGAVLPDRLSTTERAKDVNGNWICDWRRRFFNTADNNALLTDGLVNDGSNTLGSTLKNLNSSYTVNYKAVLAWVKSGPQVFPANLRGGRVRYYTHIPDDVDTGTGTTEQKNDKRFWKAYIDFVLTADTSYADTTNGRVLAGYETQGWPEGVTPDVVAASSLGQYDPPDAVAPSGKVDPKPYMRYIDNPTRPRQHLWFGPITMMAFIDWKTAYPGTSHQAQSWQLKVGVSSALDDIRANHPNDLVGLAFFADNNTAGYNSIAVHTGQDWTNLKNALFFPKTVLGTMQTSLTAEVRPFNDTVGYTGHGNVPNANGSTDPNTGLALAFNLLAPSQYVNADPARRGRRGASKIVIFETDGVPNSTQGNTLNKNGYDTYYSGIGGNHPSYPIGTNATTNTTNAQNAAYEIIGQMRKPMATANSSGTDSGLSLTNTPARVYAIGFGDIFSTTAGPAAASFLLEVQKRGGTSKSTDTAVPAYQIITGTYTTRISNLRTALERILQSGVQVTLIE